MKRLSILFVLTASLWLNTKAQQIKTPSPSPTQYVRQDFGLSSIELSYSRPGIKGRTIFGDLVPYGKVWRTGANQATTLTFGDTVNIGGTRIAPGKYGLLTIPGADSWIVIITHQTDVTNPAAYKQDQDVVRVTVHPQQLPFSQESFTILFADLTPNSCGLQLIWDNTLVTLPIQTDIDQRIMAQIDNTMNKDTHPYFAAAMYYIDNGKDLDKALGWLNKAAELDPNNYNLFYQKARCQAKLGKKKEAIASAQKSIELAKTANNADFVKLNEKLIASLQ